VSRQTLADGPDLLAVALPALNRMSDQQREYFVDRYVVGFSSEEIARAHGVSRATVEAHLRTGRCYLRERLDSAA
jgi:DNA-directed RNA polymerase specialized sigma24 family protein